MAYPKTFKWILAPNIKNDYLEILDRLIKYLERNSSSDNLHEYVRVVKDIVAKCNTEEISIAHSDFTYLYENYGVPNKSDSLQTTNKKKFDSISNSIDKFNETELKHSEYELIRKGKIVIQIKKKQTEQIKPKIAKQNIEFKSSRPDKPVEIYQKCIFETKLFFLNFYKALKLVFVSPKKLNDMQLSSRYWFLMFSFVLLISVLIFLMFFKMGMLEIIQSKIDRVIMKKGMSDQLAYVIEEKNKFVNDTYTMLKFLKDILVFSAINSVYFVVFRILKSRVQLWKFIFVNAVTTGAFVAVFQFIYRLSKTAVGNIYAKELAYAAFIVLVVCLVLNFRALFRITKLNFLKFSAGYICMLVIMYSYGTIMNVLNYLFTGRMI
jgi:hypothetical protein